MGSIEVELNESNQFVETYMSTPEIAPELIVKIISCSLSITIKKIRQPIVKL